MPRLRLRVVRGRRLCRHLHRLERPLEVALQLARVRNAGVCGGRRAPGDHRVERDERLVVLAQLQVRVPEHAIVPHVVRLDPECVFRAVDGLAEAVLRQVNGAEHTPRVVRVGLLLERLKQHLFRLDRQTGLAADPGLPEQRVRKIRRGVGVGTIARQPFLERPDTRHETVTRRAGDEWRNWCDRPPCLPGVAPVRVEHDRHDRRDHRDWNSLDDGFRQLRVHEGVC